MNKLIPIIVSVSLFSSCAVHQGTISMSHVDKGYRYKDIAIGVSQNHHVFWLGGNAQDAMIYEAKKELYKNFPLSPNEAYANFTLDIKKSFYIFFSSTKVTLTADIIGLYGSNDTVPFTKKYRNAIGQGQTLGKGLFDVGDTVIYDTKKTAVIISFPNDGEVKLKISKRGGRYSSKNMPIDKVYASKKNYMGLTIGGTYTYTEKRNDTEVTFVGSIIAFGLKSLLLHDNKTNRTIVQHYR